MPILVTPLTRRSFKNESLQDDLDAWAQAVRQVAHELHTPLIDLHARSVAAVHAMGGRAAIDLAKTPPPPEGLAAAETGTTSGAPKTPGAPAAVAASTEQLDRPQGPSEGGVRLHASPAPRRGAFSREVTEELARAVPDLRRELVP